ncbi:MAG: hypothetical protein M3336_09910, partial [Chloroflexota bacterium]|nr:hypothetical protein [Chloroflexota bacterium]
MMANLLRDAPGIPFLAGQVRLEGLLRATRDLLARGWPNQPGVQAVLGACPGVRDLAFAGACQGLIPGRTELMVEFVRAPLAELRGSAAGVPRAPVGVRSPSCGITSRLDRPRCRAGGRASARGSPRPR